MISVVTVVYNGEDYLEQTIRSVLEQDYDNVEYIIIDGGSTDGTPDIIKRYEDRIAYWVSQPDDGIYDAMNKGIGKATGDFISLLNADDWYEPGILAELAEKAEGLTEENKLTTIYCDFYRYDEDLSAESKTACRSTMKYWNGMSICHQAMFISRAVYETLGLYDLQYRLASDYDYFLRMINAGVNFVKLDSFGVNFRMSGMSVHNMRKSIREASLVNRGHFGFFSKKHFLFILNNHLPSRLGQLKLLLYKIIGKNSTTKLRKLWRALFAR